MEIIKAPEKIRYASIGKQTYIEKKRYRLINYCIKVDIDNGTLLYNTLSGELIWLSLDEKKVLIENNQSSYLLKTLTEKWFFVPVDYDEKRLADQINSLIKILAERNTLLKPITKYTILTTTDCNARCFYCYEHGRKKINMTNEVAKDAAQYIIKSCLGNPVSFRWFGGEPLYNYEVIDIFCGLLSKNNIEYKSSMVSNGYLFDKQIINKYKSIWKLDKVQITLDGTEEIYNKCKAFIYKNENPFNRVIDNIENLLDNNINVKVRINMDDHNSHDLFNLVDFLHQKFGRYYNFSVYAHLLFENTDQKRKTRTIEEYKSLASEFNLLVNYIENKKIHVKYTLDNFLRYNQCMADNDNAVVILPDGSLGKCEHFSESEFFGSIYKNDIDISVINKFKERRTSDTNCFNCALYPACIRLKMCPDISKNCETYNKKIYINGVKQRIINTFQEYMKKGVN